MNFTDKNIAVNQLLDLSKRDFIYKFYKNYEKKNDSNESELKKQIEYFYKYLPYLKDYLNHIVEKTNSRLLKNEFFIELKGNYDSINSKDENYFSKQIDIWNVEIADNIEKDRDVRKAIYERAQIRKTKSPIEYDSQDFKDFDYLSNIQRLGKSDELTNFFYKDLRPNLVTKDFLVDYIKLWDKCKADFNQVVQLPLELFNSGKLFENSYRIHLGDIKEFEKFNSAFITNPEEWISCMKLMSEQKIIENFCKILNDVSKKDWGGELNDHFTSSLDYSNTKYEAVFLFKGPAGKNKFREMKMKDLGKNNDQIVRLFKTNAGIIILQHCHNIGEDVRETMDAFAYKNEKKYCIIDGRDSYKLFKSYNLIDD